MRYASYKFLIMLFSLTNVPTSFSTLMNKLFHPYLNRFVVVYLDDIMVYSCTLEEHIEHLQIHFQVLRENQLFIKKKNYIFVKKDMHFLGQWISQGQLRMDQRKVQAICYWERPMMISELWSLLWLFNYYCHFITGYST